LEYRVILLFFEKDKILLSQIYFLADDNPIPKLKILELINYLIRDIVCHIYFLLPFSQRK